MVLLMYLKSYVRWWAPVLMLAGLTASLAVYSKPSALRPPGPPAPDVIVLNGIDVLVDQHFAPLPGLRLGLLTNHTGSDPRRRPPSDRLRSSCRSRWD